MNGWTRDGPTGSAHGGSVYDRTAGSLDDCDLTLTPTSWSAMAPRYNCGCWGVLATGRGKIQQRIKALLANERPHDADVNDNGA